MFNVEQFQEDFDISIARKWYDTIYLNTWTHTFRGFIKNVDRFFFTMFSWASVIFTLWQTLFSSATLSKGTHWRDIHLWVWWEFSTPTVPSAEPPVTNLTVTSGKLFLLWGTLFTQQCNCSLVLQDGEWQVVSVRHATALSEVKLCIFCVVLLKTFYYLLCQTVQARWPVILDEFVCSHSIYGTNSTYHFWSVHLKWCCDNI